MNATDDNLNVEDEEFAQLLNYFLLNYDINEEMRKMEKTMMFNPTNSVRIRTILYPRLINTVKTVLPVYHSLSKR